MTRAVTEFAHLFRALKAPAAARALPALADRARQEQWGYEHFAEILLSTEVNARDSHGGEGRIKTARFPARKTLEESDFAFQRSVKKTVIEHLGQLDFHAKSNVILLGAREGAPSETKSVGQVDEPVHQPGVGCGDRQPGVDHPPQAVGEVALHRFGQRSEVKAAPLRPAPQPPAKRRMIPELCSARIPSGAAPAAPAATAPGCAARCRGRCHPAPAPARR